MIPDYHSDDFATARPENNDFLCSAAGDTGYKLTLKLSAGSSTIVPGALSDSCFASF